MKRNLFMLAVTIISCLSGVFVPEAAEPMAYAPTISIVIQLLFCFLSTTEPSIPIPKQSLRALPKYLLFKMFVVPLICWAVCRLIFPEFALGALMVAGASMGVMGPFFAYLCGAEPFFVIGGVIASSFILPISMPLLSALVLSFDGLSVDGLMSVCLGSAVFLALCMLVPFCTAKALWSKTPKITQGLLDHRFSITVVCVAAANFSIFSKFSEQLLGNLHTVADALLVCLLIMVVLITIAVAASYKYPRPEALSRIIGISCVNCGIMVIVAAEFFSLPEMLLCALYTLPLMSMGVPYELCRKWMISREAAAQA